VNKKNKLKYHYAFENFVINMISEK